MRRACLVALLACAAISCVAATRVLEDDAAGFGRELLQAADSLFTCSRYCMPNQCVRVGTTGNVKCNQCYGNMRPILTGAKRGQCGCPAGMFFDYNSGTPAESTCTPCPLGSYCPNKLTFITNLATGDLGATPCGTGLTTRTRRANSAWDCVNAGGYKLVLTGATPSATLCTGDSYAVARSKQTECTACPSGFKILDSDVGNPVASEHDAAVDCLVPPGYFLKSPGQIAPCDQGSYQPKYLKQVAATVGVCTACPEGVSTLEHASTLQSDCKKLKPGYVATTIVDGEGITEATLCPQGYYCPGDLGSGEDAVAITSIGTLTYDGNKQLTQTPYIVAVNQGTADLTATGVNSARMVKCPNDAWTRALGATKVDECLIPPGFELNAGTIRLCLTNTYRANWIAYDKTTQCSACGSGILAEAIEPITLYSLDVNSQNTEYIEVNMRVKASSKSCYIEKGQGMYVAAGASGFAYKARNCGVGSGMVPNSYGVIGDKVYGLAQIPCKLCPSGTELTTTRDGTVKATNGYYSPLACVTKPGYGWDGRVATPCPRGWYNPGNNYEACKQCTYGLTTANTESLSELACDQAPGFGQYEGKNMLCPAGTYNDEVRDVDVCKPCSGSGQGTNTYTEEEGSDAPADCNVCKPGYGGDSLANCAACGGDSNAGSYGPSGRDSLGCVACPVSDVGFLFYYQNTADYYISEARAPSEATDAAQCVSAMAQIVDSYWYLSGAGTTAIANMDDTVACAGYCLGEDNCMFATLDFAGNADERCFVRIASGLGDVITAMKAVPSSDVSQGRKLLAGTKPKAVSTGLYTQWLDPGTGIGTQTDNAAATKDDCFAACDDDENCAGVVWEAAGVAGQKCKIITGVSEVQSTDASKRSLTRAKPANFNEAA